MIVAAGWVAAALVFASFFMKTMIPLRLVAIGSNLAFITYGLLALQSGVFAKVYPILVLHSCLLPLNVFRLAQIRRMLRAARSSDEEELMAQLVPFMKRERHPRGTVLFLRGDAAEAIYLVAEGHVLLEEDGKRVGAGELFGELGLFVEDKTRAMTAICVDDCVLYRLGRETALELYYQLPAFGIFLLRLLASYVAEGRVRKGASEAQAGLVGRPDDLGGLH